MTALNFVIVRGDEADYAVHSAHVREISSPTGWTKSRPVHLQALLGRDADAPSAGDKLLRIHAGNAEAAVRVSTEIGFRQLEPSQVLPLPDIMRNSMDAPLVVGVVFVENERPVLVLDPAVVVSRTDSLSRVDDRQ